MRGSVSEPFWSILWRTSEFQAALTCCLLHVESGIVCANPQARKASHCASMFDQVISIRNSAFRSQNLNDNATDEKNRSPAHSETRIYAFWEAVGGQIAALKSWNMPKVFVWQSCGLHHPCTQTDVVALTRQSACSRPCNLTVRNVLIKYSSQISLLGWCCFFSCCCLALEGVRYGDETGRWEWRRYSRLTVVQQSDDWLSADLTGMLLSLLLLVGSELRLIVTANVWIWMLPWVTVRNVLLKSQGTNQSNNGTLNNQKPKIFTVNRTVSKTLNGMWQ